MFEPKFERGMTEAKKFLKKQQGNQYLFMDNSLLLEILPLNCRHYTTSKRAVCIYMLLEKTVGQDSRG